MSFKCLLILEETDKSSWSNRKEEENGQPSPNIVSSIDIPMNRSIDGEIISNDTKETNIECVWNFLHVLLILILCNIFSFPVLLFPQHNSISYPAYWFEPTLLGTVTLILTLSLDTLIVIKYYFRENSLVSFKVFIILYVVTGTFWVFINCLCHFVWTSAIGYQHPMPFSLIVGYLVFMVHYTTLYFILSKDDSWDDKLSIRYKAFIKNRIWCYIIDLQYKGLSLLFNILPSGIQWILAFVLPFIREINYNILYYLVVESPKVEDGKENTMIGMYGFNALYVAIRLGQTTTNTTSILILVVDFALNLYSCRNVINLNKTILPTIPHVTAQLVKKRDSVLTKLILTEILEILVPFSYLMTVLLAYYGPNAEILGNIRNGYWQFKPIEDIGELVLSVTIMFLIDSSSAIIVGYLLLKACSINFVEETFKVIREKWDAIAVIIANFLTYVSMIDFFNINY